MRRPAMTADVTGRLQYDVKERPTRTGQPMYLAAIEVDLPSKGSSTLPLGMGVLAFGDVGKMLALHQKGDEISVSGRVQLNHWRGQQELQIVADSILSDRTTSHLHTPENLELF